MMLLALFFKASIGLAALFLAKDVWDITGSRKAGWIALGMAIGLPAMVDLFLSLKRTDKKPKPPKDFGNDWRI